MNKPEQKKITLNETEQLFYLVGVVYLTGLTNNGWTAPLFRGAFCAPCMCFSSRGQVPNTLYSREY